MRQRSGARELGLIVSALAVCAHFLEPRYAAVIAALAGLAVSAGVGQLIGRWRPWREPLYPLVLPLLATFTVAGAARLAAPVWPLALILPAGWLLIAWLVDLELFGFFQPGEGELADTRARRMKRIRTRRRPESELPQIVVEETVAEQDAPPHPRAFAIRSAALGLAFASFVAAGGFVSGALGDAGESLSRRHMAELVAMNAAIAGLVGFRIAALVASAGRDRMVRLLAFLEYAVPAALATAIFRTVGLPRLFVPALLTLILYVITILRESPEPIFLNRRLLKELGVLLAAAVLTTVWGLVAR